VNYYRGKTGDGKLHLYYLARNMAIDLADVALFSPDGICTINNRLFRLKLVCLQRNCVPGSWKSTNGNN
jgi:hypothetical protein